MPSTPGNLLVIKQALEGPIFWNNRPQPIVSKLHANITHDSCVCVSEVILERVVRRGIFGDESEIPSQYVILVARQASYVSIKYLQFFCTFRILKQWRILRAETTF